MEKQAAKLAPQVGVSDHFVDIVKDSMTPKGVPMMSRSEARALYNFINRSMRPVRRDLARRFAAAERRVAEEVLTD